ncbi:MAG: hypothetical protein U5R48_08435 [Gammaproteobacteria bacterium]|nr:hypothetical protein [Gammaproteobacteria bacterium]
MSEQTNEATEPVAPLAPAGRWDCLTLDVGGAFHLERISAATEAQDEAACMPCWRDRPDRLRGILGSDEDGARRGPDATGAKAEAPSEVPQQDADAPADFRVRPGDVLKTRFGITDGQAMDREDRLVRERQALMRVR